MNRFVTTLLHTCTLATLAVSGLAACGSPAASSPTAAAQARASGRRHPASNATPSPHTLHGRLSRPRSRPHHPGAWRRHPPLRQQRRRPGRQRPGRRRGRGYRAGEPRRAGVDPLERGRAALRAPGTAPHSPLPWRRHRGCGRGWPAGHRLYHRRCRPGSAAKPGGPQLSVYPTPRRGSGRLRHELERPGRRRRSRPGHRRLRRRAHVGNQRQRALWRQPRGQRLSP